MSDHCPISGKYVPRKNPSDGYLVLSPEGEEVRFCCPSHKTRYLRENPGSVEVNPAQVHQRGDETYDSIATKIDGQRVVLTFFRSDEDDASDVWNVALLVGATRKEKKSVRLKADWSGSESGRGRGRVGLKALIWAKKQIDIFQEEDPDATVVVGADDDRRARAYRALTRAGFRPGRYMGERVLFRGPSSGVSNGHSDWRYPKKVHRRRRAAPRQRRNPTDLKGRHIPEKYLAGLSAKERKQRIAELTEQRGRKGQGDKRYAELKTDRLARKKGLVKQSAYSQVAEKRGIQIRYKGAQPDFKATARAALRYYRAKGDVNEIADLLEQSYDKGLAAWQSGGHRPGASQRNWGDARVHSLLVGGKTAWYPSADRKQARLLPYKMQEGIIRQMPEVFKALKAQGRQKDITYLRPKHNAVMKLI